MDRKTFEEAVYASELNTSARFILLQYARRLDYGTKEEQEAWPGESTVAKETGMHRATVRKYVAALVEDGWLKPASLHGRAQGYTLAAGDVKSSVLRNNHKGQSTQTLKGDCLTVRQSEEDSDCLSLRQSGESGEDADCLSVRQSDSDRLSKPVKVDCLSQRTPLSKPEAPIVYGLDTNNHRITIENNQENNQQAVAAAPPLLEDTDDVDDLSFEIYDEENSPPLQRFGVGATPIREKAIFWEVDRMSKRFSWSDQTKEKVIAKATEMARDWTGRVPALVERAHSAILDEQVAAW